MLFPEKANYHWLNGDYPVIIISMTLYARVMRVEAFVIAQKRANRDTCYCNLHKKIGLIATWNAVIIQACVEHIFCFGVETLESVLDDFLAEFSSK